MGEENTEPDVPSEADAPVEQDAPAPAEEPVAEVEAPAEAAPAAKPKRAAKPKAEPKPKKATAAKAETKPRAAAKRVASERKPIVRTPRPERERGKRKERRGLVVSSAMDKTIVVRVETVRPHRAYKKVIRRSTKFHAHDEQNAANVGDVVRIVESPRISKTKVWRLAEILEVAK